MIIDPDMPDEMQEAQPCAHAVPSERNDALLEVLGVTIARLRDEAVTARKASGIEQVWMECEEAYLGIDDSNRHEFAKAQWAKPTSMAGSVAAERTKTGTKSTAFVRLTSRYVDMGAAKISEITLPIDDKAFSLEPTPVPDLVKAINDTTPLTGAQGQAVMRPQAESEPGQMVQATRGDLAKLTLDSAKDYAKKAETRIYDWMLEAKYPAEMRKVVFDAARLGAGCIKAPFPQVRTSWVRQDKKLHKKSRITPGLRHTSVWNLYPDPSCGENIHDGDHIFECDKITPAKLEALKREKLANGQPIYIASQIDKVIKEGPGKRNETGGNPSQHKHNDKQFKIWYFTGIIKREDMVLMGAVGMDDLPDDLVHVNAIVTMVNDSVIRATVNPLESGKFPYRVICWSRRDGFWAGVGVGEQVTMPQRMVNAGTRALLNNAGKSAGAQTVIDQRSITPADGKWEMTPDKLWFLTPNSNTDDVRKIFMSVALPNLGPQLMAIIEYAFRLGEEACNIPLVVQGRDGDNAPQTFGAAELNNSNAHTLLRSIAYVLDDSITEPVVEDLYEWLLLDDDVPEDEKGDFKINAKGSSAMVEKSIQEQILGQLLPASINPVFGLNPKLVAAEYLKSKRLDPRKLCYSDEELAKMAQQPPVEAPVITAAKIRAEAQIKTAQGHDQATVAKTTADTDRDRVYVEAETERSRNEHTARMTELNLKRELAMLDYANKRELSLEAVKKELAINSMRLQTQITLAGTDGKGPQVATPPTEPPGRAAPGEAYQR